MSAMADISVIGGFGELHLGQQIGAHPFRIAGDIVRRILEW